MNETKSVNILGKFAFESAILTEFGYFYLPEVNFLSALFDGI